MKNQTAQVEKSTVKNGHLYMALELSENKWRIGFGDGHRIRQVVVEGGNLVKLQEEIKKAKAKFGLANTASVFSCYEAGREGFWIHRYLTEVEITNIIVDSSSIEVNRRARRAKTDRLDAQKLLVLLVRHVSGEKGMWKIVRVPSKKAEDARRLHRERNSLKKEQTRLTNRLKSMLVLQGIKYLGKKRQSWKAYLETLVSWNGEVLSVEVKEELSRAIERLSLVDKQISEIENTMLSILEDSTEPAIQQIKRLMQLKAVGLIGAWQLVMEWFSWRQFKNRREVGALAGLTGTPYASGYSQREQGISKSGNRRIRALMIQLSWIWLRYQPNSALTLWFKERFNQSKRFRKVGIVAVARRLLIDLWRYVTQDILPKGAILKPI